MRRGVRDPRGEFLILLGAYRSTFLGTPWYAAVAALGVILAAVYLLRSYQQVFFGRVENEANRGLADLTPREIAVLLPVVFFIVWIGVYPSTFLDKTEAASRRIVRMVEEARTGVRVRTAELPQPGSAPGRASPRRSDCPISSLSFRERRMPQVFQLSDIIATGPLTIVTITALLVLVIESIVDRSEHITLWLAIGAGAHSWA